MKSDFATISIDASKVNNAVLKRLIEEVRIDREEAEETNIPVGYDRSHNRHNRGGGTYDRGHNRHNRGR